jgi:hypothetical protein
MSENSRHLADAADRSLSPKYLPEDKLKFFEDGGGRGPAFSSLPFDHLLFTGSGATGRAVMANAARNLTPVTLELGGKSPAIVAPDFAIETAAERIIWVKMLNAGQICTNVDYVFLPEAAVACIRRALQASCRPALPRPQRERLHLDHRRALVRPPAGRARRRPRQGRDARQPGRRAGAGRESAQVRAAHRAWRDRRHGGDAARDLRPDPAGAHLPRQARKSPTMSTRTTGRLRSTRSRTTARCSSSTSRA